ncbi:MAG: nitrite reductase (NAD(P)H) small subunit [Alteromonadaceae bacterium]|nr:MAG: nitrite reductase (NAD(P)H) small subunit [Alteromonadaceae bacterium]
MSEENKNWQAICASTELTEPLGVRALLGDEQVAIFKVKNELYAVSAIDPFTNAAVLARGIVGDLSGKTVVASPIYKQHFCLSSGACLEDEDVSVKTYAVRDNGGQIELAQH